MSINKSIMLGRLTADPELKKTNSGKSVATFSVALDRGGKDKGADFPTCIAWEGRAEFICKYFHKGDWIGLEARIQTRTYEAKDGSKRYATEFVVTDVSFAGAKKEGGQGMSYGAPADDRLPFPDEPWSGYTDMGPDDGTEMPF